LDVVGDEAVEKVGVRMRKEGADHQGKHKCVAAAD